MASSTLNTSSNTQTCQTFVTETQLKLNPSSISPHPVQQQSQLQPSPHIEMPVAGSRKKLRESCNNCALSKVKCSKDQPVCVRCDDRGMFCRYSLSRRTGKRGPSSSSSSSTSLADGNLNSSSVESITPPDEIPLFDFHDLGSNSLLNFGDGKGFDFFDLVASGMSSQNISPQRSSTPISKRACPNPQATRIFDDGVLPWDDSMFTINIDNSKVECPKFDLSMGSSDFISPTYLDIDMTDHSSDMTVTPTAYDGMASIFGTVGPGSITTPTAITPAASTTHHHRHHRHQTSSTGVSVESTPSPQMHLQQDCTSLALATLQSLHMPPSTCISVTSNHSTSNHSSSSASSSTPATPTPTIDHVITTNRAIIDSVIDILSCPCSLDTHLALVLTLIASKTVAWYSAITRNSSEVQSPEPVPHNGGCFTERVNPHSPVSVGKYHLDGVDKRKMRAQLVLSELHRVVKLVDMLGKKFSQVKVAGSTHDGSGGMAGELEIFLRARVRAVTKETMDVLRER